MVGLNHAVDELARARASRDREQALLEAEMTRRLAPRLISGNQSAVSMT
jgi:hypothetical protein